MIGRSILSNVWINPAAEFIQHVHQDRNTDAHSGWEQQVRDFAAAAHSQRLLA
jgi:hypothetical protein